MSKIFEWVYIKAKFIFLMLAIASSFIGIFKALPFEDNALTESSINQLLNDHESFVKTKNLEGQMSLFHEDFTISINHASGREENLNKDQYKKMMSDLNNMNIGYSIDEKSKEVSKIDSETAVVTMLSKQRISLGNSFALHHDTDLYQTIFITQTDKGPKILKVLSVSKKA